MSKDTKNKFLADLAPKDGHERDRYFASILQRDVKSAEIDQLNQRLDDYDEATVNQAIVHTRQDMVLVYDMLTSNNKLLHRINKQLSILVVLAIALAIFIFISVT
jgi:hypothetical protein